ncbi:PLDc N-terminal domain-containing protein [Patescibacteria group bacterium]|nr:PLDc N-terminal domain-containing protein [Patescibacteria group bacterium]
MKTKILPALIIVALIAPISTLAAPEDAAGVAFMGIFGGFMMIWQMIFFGIMALNVAGFVFWIFMIVDVAKHQFKDETERLTWILVVVLAGWIGAIIYYFTIKAKDKKINGGTHTD